MYFSCVTDLCIEQKHTKYDSPYCHLKSDRKATKQELHNVERGQQVESPLLYSHETPHAVLHPALGPSAQEEICLSETREDHENHQRDGKLL